MSNITPFNFENNQVRVITYNNGEPWFNANDVCEALQLGNPRQALESHVDSDDVQRMDAIDSLGRTQQANHINESGLYALIFGSTKDDAKRFKKWVTSEVLPSIRKTGSYGKPVNDGQFRIAQDAAKAFPAFFRVARLIGCDKNAAAISANQAVASINGTNLLVLLGATHLEAANQDTQWFTPTELGKRINTSARGVNLLLAEAGLQMKRGDAWEVTEAGHAFTRLYDTGKKHGTGVPITQIKWSPNVLPMLGAEKEAA